MVLVVMSYPMPLLACAPPESGYMDFLYCLGRVKPAFLTHVLIVSALQFHFLARSVGLIMSSTHSAMICCRCSGVRFFVVRPELLIRKNEEQNKMSGSPKIKKAAVLMQEDIGEWIAIMNEAI